MERGKLKNAVIFILLMVNIFFLILFLIGRTETGKMEQQAREKTMALLTKNGIALDSHLLKPATLPRCDAERDLEAEGRFAAALLGSGTKAEDLGGGVWSYTSLAGTGTFRSSGDFSIRFTDPQPDSDAGSKAAGAYLEKAGLQLEKAPQSSLSGNRSIYTFTCRFAESPVFNCTVRMVYDESGALLSLSGRIPGFRATAEYEEKTISVHTALVHFLQYLRSSGQVCTQVLDLRMGWVYSCTISSSGSLQPHWCVYTDSGVYYVNASGGEVTTSLL